MATDETGDETRVAYIQALEQALRPLVPLALNYGVTYPDLMEMVRNLYITALADRLTKEGRPATAARMGIMTGLNRGEIEKLHFGKGKKDQGSSVDLDGITALLTTWNDDNRFSTPYGAPLDLSLTPEEGFKTLDDLIEVASPGIDREIVLDKLVAAGCIEVHGEKFIRCTNRNFRPGDLDMSRVKRLGRYVGALAATFARNLGAEHSGVSFFEAVNSSDFPISSDGRDAALVHIRGEGIQFLESIDRWWSEKGTKYMDENGSRYGVGLFFFADNEKAEFNKVVGLEDGRSISSESSDVANRN
jgi:hypothetical protein